MKCFLTLIFIVVLSISASGQYQSPESAIWDNVNKRYFISNAGSGTIATVDWGGRTENAWVSGLIQPKAMLIIDSTLYILDYTTMKTYNVNTGISLKNETVPTATFMNDMCMDADSNFYITETYDNSIIKYDWKRKTYAKITLKGFIDKPNGILYDGDRLLIVSFRENSPIQAISLPGYEVSTVLATDIDFMDGIAKDEKGNIFFSAWIDQNTGSGKVYRVKDDFSGKIETVITNLDGPADIYYNLLNDTLVVPNMSGSWVGFYPFIDPPPVPKLINPESGAEIQNLVELVWTKSRAARTYTVQFGYQSDFSISESVNMITDTSQIIRILNECDTLYWRVKAVNTEGESDWSEVRFLIPRKPNSTELIQPANNEENVSTHPDFIWKPRETSYRLMIDTVPELNSDYLIEEEIFDSTYSRVELMSNTKYYWTVQGLHCDESAPGDTFSFKTIDASLPEKTDLIYPESDAAEMRTDSIEFRWKNTGYTDYFKFFLSDKSDFSNIIESDSIPNQTQPMEIVYMLKNELNCDGKYYWMVSTYNQFGYTESETNMFETIPCLSIDDKADFEQLLIYPNPSTGSFYIRFNTDITGAIRIELVNSIGIKCGITSQIHEGYIKIDTDKKLSNGIYLIRIVDGSKEYLGKLLIIE